MSRDRPADTNTFQTHLRIGIYCDTLFSWAVAKNHLGLAKFLMIHWNADVNKGPNNGDTPLSLTVEKGQLDFAEWLLDHGADVNQKTKQGDTLLSSAEKKGHTKLAQLLKESIEEDRISREGEKHSTELFNTVAEQQTRAVASLDPAKIIENCHALTDGAGSLSNATDSIQHDLKQSPVRIGIVRHHG